MSHRCPRRDENRGGLTICSATDVTWTGQPVRCVLAPGHQGEHESPLPSDPVGQTVVLVWSDPVERQA